MIELSITVALGASTLPTVTVSKEIGITVSFATLQVTGGGDSSVWGGITGTLSNQTDLQNALDAKASVSSVTAVSDALTAHLNDSTDAHDGSAISLDNSRFTVLTANEVQTAFEETDNAILNASNTGVRFGGAASITGSNTVTITAGAGGIIDLTDPENPVYTAVTWATQTDVTLSNTSVSVSYWYFDDSGILQQHTGEPTKAEYRMRIYICSTSYTGGNLTAISNISVPLQQTTNTVYELSKAIGTVRVSGSSPTYSGANLKLKITAGEFFDYGTQRWSAPTAPNTVYPPEFDSGVSSVFRYLTTNGVIPTNVTDIDVAHYQVSGSVVAIPGSSNRVGVHYVVGLPSGNTRVAYGSAYYNNFDDAIRALTTTDPYTNTPSTITRRNSFILGAVLAQAGATDLSNTSQAKFVTTNQFGNFGGSVLGLAGVAWGGITGTLSDQTDLQAALDAKADVTALGYDPSARSEYFCDFTGLISSIGSSSANLSECSYVILGGSGASIVGIDINGETDVIGVFRLSAATSSTNRAVYATRGWVTGNGEIVFETKLRIPTLSDSSQRFYVRAGFVNSSAVASTTDGIYFRYIDNLNSGQWQLVCISGSTATVTNTASAPIANTWYKLRIVINSAASSVGFYIDGVLVGTITTNIPTNAATLQGIWGIERTVGTTARTLDSDYMYIKKAMSR